MIRSLLGGCAALIVWAPQAIAQLPYLTAPSGSLRIELDGGFMPSSREFADGTSRRLGDPLGSGAILICDQNTCIVDLVKVLLQFFRFESCGKCTPCRVGTQRSYEIVDRISKGQGKLEDLDTLIELAKEMERAANCGLGGTAAVPIRDMLKHFRTETEAHILLGTCPAGICEMNPEVELA